MTARESAELRGLISPSTTALRAGLFLVVLFACAWMLRAIQTAISESVLPVWLLPTLVLGVLLYRVSGRWTGGDELRERVRRDLERGEVAQHRIRVAAALEAPEVEDEGPVFFIREEAGPTLFFAGQDMARYKSRGFPWREFEVALAPASGKLFKLRSLGEPFRDLGARPSLTFAEAKDLGVLASPWGILEQRLEDLRKKA